MSDQGSSPNPDEKPADIPREKKESESPDSVRKSGKSPFSIVLGFLFILPAIAALIFSYIVPTIRTFLMSFQNAAIFKESVFIGMENYRNLFAFPNANQAIIFTLLISLVRVLVVLFPPLILAIGSAALKPALRKVVRVVSSIPWMLYSPLALAIAWMLLVNPSFGLGVRAIYLGNPDTARWIVLAMDGLSYLGLSCGVGLTVYLSVLMGQDESTGSKKPITAMLVTAAILVMGTFALAIQSGQAINLLTNGGPGFSTTTLSQMIFNQAFSQMRLGLAAAFASPALLLVILIGIGLVILTIATQLRMSILPKQPTSVSMAGWLKVVGIILMALVMVSILFSILPYLAKWIPLFGNPVGFFGSFSQVSSQPIFWKSVLNTWYVPILIVVLFQLPITVLAAISIGGLRPLGRASEWLLLIFAPWLLITPVLLIPGYIQTLVNLELINSYFGLLIPFMMNIPLLMVLTLFYHGQVLKIEEKGETPKFFKDLFVPSLPLIGIGLVFGLLFIQQDTVWSTAVLSSPDHWFLTTFFRRYFVSNLISPIAQVEMMTLLRIPAFIGGFLLLGAYQLFYFPRLGLQVGSGEEAEKK